ncbi:MAG: long-chain fatty acid--CoA ligase [Deltaproteobacteria bacterium]|jgi:long-chain acyl-CoA synthetase
MTSYRSVADMFEKRVASTPNNLAYQFPEGESGWRGITWREAGERVRAIACGLRSLGLEDEQRVAIQSTTRVEWILADFGILCGAGATTTVYPSNTSEECAFILSDSETVMVFAENDEQVQKLVEAKPNIPTVKQVITFEGKASDDGWVMTLDDLIEKGKAWDAENEGQYTKIVESVESTDLATLIYTSGTTGRPKGVELTHDCWVFEGEAIRETGILRADDHQYLWLPLSHSFGKVLEVAQLAVGFPTTVDGRIPKLVDNLGVIKPTFMAAAPRIFEKVYNKVVTGAAEAGGMKYKIFSWSVQVGREVSALKQQGQEPGGMLAMKFSIADKLVFSKLRDRFGGRIRFFISGSAPLSREMAEFFHAANILICEGYGLTESSAASFVNLPGEFRFGTVGKPVPGVKVKIADDGEILLGGRGIMRGYRNLPDVTSETLNEEGWLMTGDIGELDGDGFLKITDRKKDLIKTSGGKYIAPQKIEGTLKALCPYLSQVIVHGDRRNFCSALVTLDDEAIPKWAAEHGVAGSTAADFCKDAKVIAMVQEAVDELNKQLASYETIKKFEILERDLTIEDGELTASLKVKRKVVEKKHMDKLDAFYGDAMKKI